VRDLLPSFGPARGYGDILWRAISAIDSEVLVFLQPDVAGESVPALIRPLLDREELALIKGFHGHSVVRPDVLARPLINLYRPELAGFIEPLSKNFAARRSLLETLPFPVGDGAMLSLLFDAARDCGVASVAQTELSSRETAPAGNTSPETAYAVLTAAIRRTEHETPPLPGPLFAPSPEGLKTHRVPLEERPPLTSLNEPTYARQTSD
jgi:glucosyl-3-phosphoglycerate synthase